MAACICAPSIAAPRGVAGRILGGSTSFGKTSDGRTARLYTLSNKNGTIVRFTDYGGLITEVQTRDRAGKRANVVLGFKSATEYEARNSYGFGSPIGRYANRIGNARFTLDGKTYNFKPNNGPHLLHGGAPGYNTRYW